MRVPRVAILTGGVPHYRYAFFEALAESGCQLDVIAAGTLGDGFRECAGSASFRLHRLAAPTRRWRSDVLRVLQALKPDVLVSEHGASLDYVWTVMLSLRLRRIPKLLWTHGIARQELFGGQRGIASLGRWTQLRAADGIVCYDRAMAARLQSVFTDRLVVAAPNTNDGRALSARREELVGEGQQRARSRLGLPRSHYLVAVGRLVHEKQHHRLINVLHRVRRAGIDVGLIVVGDGPERAHIEAKAREHGLIVGSDVTFCGAITNPVTLADYLFAADASVSAGPLGLAVVDCLFAGVPTISFLPAREGPWHGPEWRYLLPNETGFFASSTTDEALASQCIQYLRKPLDEREIVRHSCASYARRELGVEHMVAGMRRAIDHLVRRPSDLAAA